MDSTKFVDFVQSNGQAVFVPVNWIAFVRAFTTQPGQTTLTKTIIRLKDGQTLYLRDTMRDIYYLLVDNQSVTRVEIPNTVDGR